jgi:hypothetical protein
VLSSISGAIEFVPNSGFSFTQSKVTSVLTSGCLAVGTTTDCGAGRVIANAAVQTGTTTVASLPTCDAAAKGKRHFVTDANSTTYHAIAVGGGANNMASPATARIGISTDAVRCG